LQAQGYDAADIDGTCVQFGMARGPCGGTMASAGQTDSAITDRLLHDLGREGERILSDGQVQRPLDIDIAALHTLGFPAYRGGPMFAVGMRG
jgi:3-hydroxyacyl-CoA dehydrogenase